MGRHGKNATASAVYSYHERKKDTGTCSGGCVCVCVCVKQRETKLETLHTISLVDGKYGSQSLRLGKDSVKEFDCCSLTLQPCRNPVIT